MPSKIESVRKNTPKPKRTGIDKEIPLLLVVSSGLVAVEAAVILLAGPPYSLEGAADTAVRVVAVIAASLVGVGAIAYGVKKESETSVVATEGLFDALPMPAIASSGKAVRLNPAAARLFPSVSGIKDLPGPIAAHVGFYHDQKTGRHYEVVRSVEDGPAGETVVCLVDRTAELRLEKAKNEFIASVGHHLRTPLTGVRWLAEMAAQESGKGSSVVRKGRLVELEKAATRMTATVDRLLLAAQLEAGTFKPAGRPVDLCVIVRSTLNEVAEAILARRLAVSTSFPESAVMVSVDSEIVGAAIEEIVTNAIKFNRPGGSLKVQVTADGVEVRLQVTDSGLGVPADLGEDIFRKFVRGDNLEATDSYGDGLGLYLARSIVEVSGGKIRFVSKEGEGSSFFVTFPSWHGSSTRQTYLSETGRGSVLDHD